MANPLSMIDRVVIVTGGTKGVGRGIAQTFLDHGAQVIVCARKDPELPLAESGGRRAQLVKADVRDPEQIAQVVARAEEIGRLDVLVNNAGGSPYADAADASPRFSEAIIRLNLIAPLNFCQAANRVMQTQSEGGSIVNIASVSGVRPSPGTAAYGAAKAGLLNLTTSLAVEWGPKVRVNAIIAGLIKTEQSELHYGDAEGVARVSSTVPLGRMADPSDIGGLCLFLSSPLAAYVSGAQLHAHGGGEKPAFLEAATANKS